jgi:hypothetical protein
LRATTKIGGDLPATNLFVDMRSNLSARWLPYECELPDTSSPAFRRCMDGKRIDFKGDSHARIFFNHLLKAHCGVENAALKGINEDQCFGFHTMPLCPRLSACFTRSDFLDYGGAGGHGAERDFIVLSFGNHPASGAHWTQDQFANKARDVFSQLTGEAKRGSQRPRVLTLSVVPIPFRTDGWAQIYGDARTFSRMLLFDRTARKAAEPYVNDGTLAFVDIFALSMAANRWSPDRAHLYRIDAALRGVIDLVFLDLCGQVEGNSSQLN